MYLDFGLGRSFANDAPAFSGDGRYGYDCPRMMLESLDPPQATAPKIKSSVRIPALDGLRGIAILLVLLAHTVFFTSFRHHPVLNRLLSLGSLSFSGVDLFFVLSGFLIGGILLDHLDSPRYFTTFYLRRAYRILPLYVAVVLFCLVVSQLSVRGWTPFGQLDIFVGPVPWWSFAIFGQNLAMAVTGGSGRGGLGVTWSLAIEEQFYLTLPLVLRWVAPRNLICWLAAVIGFAPILRILLAVYWPRGTFAGYVFTPCRADALSMGVLCAVMVRKENVWDYLVANRRWVYAVAGVLGLCLAAITLGGYSVGSAAGPKTLYGLELTVLAFFYGTVVLLAVTGDDKFVRKGLCNPLLMKLGGIAYGTYLFHPLCIGFFLFLATHLIRPTPGAAFIAAQMLGVAATLGLATVSWRRFEKALVGRGYAHQY